MYHHWIVIELELRWVKVCRTIMVIMLTMIYIDQYLHIDIVSLALTWVDLEFSANIGAALRRELDLIKVYN